MKTLMLLLLCSPVLADTVTYQSQTLAGTATEIDGVTLVNPINDVYTITVTIAGPLAANLSNQMITPQSWTVQCQSCSQDLSASPTGTPTPPFELSFSTSAVFLFSTDSTGKITNWSFAISGNSVVTYDTVDSNGNPDISTEQQNKGSFSGGVNDSATSQNDSNSGHRYIVTTSGPKGTWTQSSLANPAPAAPAVLARTCNGTWGVPSNTVAGGLTPNANGTGMNCRMPSAYPGAWFIKVTPDGGKTYEFVTLSSLGLGNGK